MSYVVREYKPNDLQEAGKLAAMWNASDEGWPGGWTGGVSITAERMLEDMSRHDHLADFVVEYGDEIVGYGSLSAQAGQKDLAYVPLLNVRPDHHGRGLGRRLLRAVIDRAIELGYRQVDLGTWAGNTKAVPLYKKMGFFWRPESNVHMQNFLPTILALPLAQPFFAQRDWYSCFRRELLVQPDDVEWHGVKVYPYEFEANGERLKVVIDTESRSVTAVETNDLAVACFVGVEEVPMGLEQTVTWEVEWKGNLTELRGTKGNGGPGSGRRGEGEKSLSVVLLAEGEEGIGLRVQESLEVAGKVTIQRPFTVAPDIKPKEPGQPAHKIRSTLVLNGQPLTLETAVKPVQPVEVEFGGSSLLPGKREKLTVKLRSRVDFPVSGQLQIAPHPALQFDRLTADFHLAAKSWCGLVFWVTAPAEGVFRTTMTVQATEDGKWRTKNGGREMEDGKWRTEDRLPTSDFRSFSTRPKPVTFRAVPVGGLLVDVDEEDKNVHLESDRLSVYFNRRGGWMGVHDKVRGRQVFGQPIAEVGPPFVGWRECPPTYEVEAKVVGSTAVLTVWAPSDRLPGVTVEKRVTFSGGSVVRVDHRVLNASGRAQKLKLQVHTWSNLGERIVLPLKAGVVREPFGWGQFPAEREDLSRQPEDYAESWIAWEDETNVGGLVWHECAERDEGTLLFDLPELEPRSFVDLEPLYLVAEHGDWHAVRHWWWRLIQPGGARELRRPEPRRVLEAGFAPPPLLLSAPEERASLSITNERRKGFQGAARLESEELTFAPAAWDLPAVNRDAPFAQEVKVAAASLEPRIIPARLKVTTDTADETFDLPVVMLGDGSQTVALSDQPAESEEAWDTLVVDNGFLTLKIAPGFFGSAYALERGGVNHLRTGYPQAGPFVWLNPWYGGIHPFVNWPGEQRFAREKFTGQFRTRTGQRGLTWQGVKVACDVEHKDYRWLRLEAEYLTRPGSNLVALVTRCTNRTTGPMGVHHGVMVWTAPGGTVDHTVLHYEQGGVLRHRRRSPYAANLRSGPWAASENPDRHVVLGLIRTAQDAHLTAWDLEANGVHFECGVGFGLEPEETREALTWLVFTDSVAAARAYKVLEKVWELP